MLYLCLTVQKIGQFFHPLNGEGGIGNGLHGNIHQLHGIIIRSHTVGAEVTAAAATVDDGPLALIANPNSNGFHDATAIGFPVTGLYIHVEAAQAVGAMIAMIAGSALRHYQTAAEFAFKTFVAGVGLIISLLKCLSFVFTIHIFSSFWSIIAYHTVDCK